MKRHFRLSQGSACGRGKALTDNPEQVTCNLCQNKEAFVKALIDFNEAQEAAFQAQVPHTIVPQFGRVNDDGVMECFKCEGILFRERPRSTWSYHYVCSNCGTSMHPLTETGMCN